MTPSLRRTSLACALVVLLAACQSPAATTTPSASETSIPSADSTATAEATATASQPSSEEASPTASDDPSDAFTVTPNADADALFLDRDQCENLEDGYRLEFPDAWYTNTAVGDVQPCQWFTPDFYEVDDPDEVPSEIAITIRIVPGEVGSILDVISDEAGVVGETQSAFRFEERGTGTEGSEFPASYRAYYYVVQLGPSSEQGPNLMAMTTTKMGGDYELNKAVLDRIMATMEFIGTIE
jgi:hypothetical protein